jgi:hypothetical protein
MKDAIRTDLPPDSANNPVTHQGAVLLDIRSLAGEAGSIRPVDDLQCYRRGWKSPPFRLVVLSTAKLFGL